MKTMDDFDFKGKKVIIRVAFDVPMDEEGNITDDKRINIAIPTIKALLDRGASQLILMTHLDRPKDHEPKLMTNKVAERLGEILGQTVAKVDDWGENGIPEDKIVMLENLRFNKGEKSKDEAERDEFGKQLGSLADIYVNDAFSNCHRDHASMTSVGIPGCLGLSVQKEYETLSKASSNPERPLVVIIGGLKADKIKSISTMLKKADKVLVGGSIAFAILRATGVNIGSSKIDEEGLEEEVIEEIKNNPNLTLPIDAVVADKFEADAESKTVSVNDIPDGWMALDIGPDTVKLYQTILKEAKTVAWFGPIGVFEFDKFVAGTKAIAQTLADSDATTIIGGGDSAAAVDTLGYADKMTLVSSGGGASLKLFEGKELVAIKVLE